MTSPWAVAADILDPAPLSDWTPFPKQALATELAGEVGELLFGGAAGPGKSEWLMEYVIGEMERHPRNRGVIFRRVFPSLNRTIIPRLKFKLAGRAKWNANEHTFTFPNDSILECASLQYADDVTDYQGAEYGVIGWEEITEFMQSQYEFLLTRLRAPADGIRPHSVATTNPGGTGHTWVKKRWIKPDPKADDFPGESPVPFRAWRPKSTALRPEPMTRAFVPATLEDNPKLLERDPEYLHRIQGMSNRGLRLALEKGDWDAIDAVEGALWVASELDGGRVSPGWIRTKVRSFQRVIAVDPSDGDAGGDGFGVASVVRGQDGVAYVDGSWEWRASPRRMAQAAIELYHDMGASALVVERNHGGKWMVEVFRGVDDTVNVQTVWASDNKRTRAEPVAALFELNAKAAVGESPYKVRMVGFHPELEEQMTTTTFKPGDKSPDRIDAMVWGLSYLMLGQRDIQRAESRDLRLVGRR